MPARSKRSPSRGPICTETYKEDNSQLHAVIPTNHQPLDDAMLDKGVDVNYQKESGSGWVSILINAIPVRAAAGVLDFHDAPDAERRQQSSELSARAALACTPRNRRR